MKTSHRIAQLGSYIMALLQQAAKKQAHESGKPVLDLAAGNPSFPVAKEVKEKLRELCLEDINFRYPGFSMIPEFTEAVFSYYKTRFGVDLEGCKTVPLMGAKDGVSHINLALFDEGDEVLVPDPGYPTYSIGAKLVGATPIFYSLSKFLSDPTSIKEKITSKSKAIWLDFPNNPTGAVIDVPTYQKVVDLALEHSFVIINDNPYVDMNYDGEKAPSIFQAKNAEKVAIEMMSMSKDFSLAGVRMGYAVGEAEIVNALSNAKSQMDSGMCLLHQKLAVFCLNQWNEEWCQKWFKERDEYYQDKRDKLCEFLEKKLDVKIERPKGALYLWFKVPGGFKNGSEYAEYVLKEHSILLVPGIAYGQEGEMYVRASFAVFDL